MQSHAFLINIARGNLVQELPLFQALQEGRIAGYAADVWWNYTNSFPATYHFPVPSRTGLHKLPGVLASGDQAANVEGMAKRNIDRGIQALVEFAGGKPLTGEIDSDVRLHAKLHLRQLGTEYVAGGPFPHTTQRVENTYLGAQSVRGQIVL